MSTGYSANMSYPEGQNREHLLRGQKVKSMASKTHLKSGLILKQSNIKRILSFPCGHGLSTESVLSRTGKHTIGQLLRSAQGCIV